MNVDGFVFKNGEYVILYVDSNKFSEVNINEKIERGKVMNNEDRIKCEKCGSYNVDFDFKIIHDDDFNIDIIDYDKPILVCKDCGWNKHGKTIKREFQLSECGLEMKYGIEL